ncbi:MAG TPA: hypothetical protein VHO70_17890 [Chitinispirillaceae bacterium]|nr:hypothetical protein [Chitinispirillaceae bacterium]
MLTISPSEGIGDGKMSTARFHVFILSHEAQPVCDSAMPHINSIPANFT